MDRLSQLREFREKLNSATDDPGQGFADNVKRALELDVFQDERAFALRLSMSRTQINRWKNGRSVPPRGTVRNVYRVILAELDARPID